MQNLEQRHIATELRMVSGNTLTGYAARFNQLSQDLGGFRERINPGAFRKSLGGDIRAFWNHNMDSFPLGRTKSGTLRLSEDEDGLRFEIDLPDTQDARDLRQSVSRGDVDGVSFGFVTRKDNWTEKGTIRTLLEVDLIEVSPVNYAAYEGADFSLALRSRDAALAEEEAEAEPVAEEPKGTPKRNLAEKQLQISRLQNS